MYYMIDSLNVDIIAKIKLSSLLCVRVCLYACGLDKKVKDRKSPNLQLN